MQQLFRSFLPILLLGLTVPVRAESPSILIVVSNVSRVPDTEVPTGVWGEELVLPFYRFLDEGFRVTLASPTGGAFVFDPSSFDTQWVQDRRLRAQIALFKAEESERMAKTLPLAEVRVTDHAAVFVAGGHGVMFDLARDPEMARITREILDSGRILAAVCHGPCFLPAALRADGTPCISGYEITAFSNEEEVLSGMVEHMPFSLQDALEKAGGRYRAGPPWKSHTVRDRNLITGQNPASSEAVASQLIASVKNRDQQIEEILDRYYDSRDIAGPGDNLDYGMIYWGILARETSADGLRVTVSLEDVDTGNRIQEILLVDLEKGAVREVEVQRDWDGS